MPSPSNNVIHQHGDVVSLYAAGTLQARIDLSRPEWLSVPYTRWMAQAVASSLNGDATEVLLHVGGGLLALPRYLSTTLPAIHQIVFELDLDLIRMCRSLIEVAENTEIVHSDGREGTRRRPPLSADAIVVDAIDLTKGCSHLMSVEFFAECAGTLKHDGVFVLNAATTTKNHLERLASGLLAHFPHTYWITESFSQPQDVKNAVFFGTRNIDVFRGALRDATSGAGVNVTDLSGSSIANEPYRDVSSGDVPIPLDRARRDMRLAEVKHMLSIVGPRDRYREILTLVRDQLEELIFPADSSEVRSVDDGR